MQSGNAAVIGGAFEPAAADGVAIRAATGLDASTIAAVQADVRGRLLLVFAGRGLLPCDAALTMGQRQHGGGFFVDGSVRVATADSF